MGNPGEPRGGARNDGDATASWQLDDDATATWQADTGDATARVPRTGPAGDETQVVPDAARWAGRAGVRRGDTSSYPAQQAGDWDAQPDGWHGDDPYDGRSWLRPVILALVIFVLLAAIAVGGWLVYKAVGLGGGQPATTPSAAASASSGSPSATPSSPAPSSASPTPAGVPVPQVVGVNEGAARQTMDAVGLTYTVQYRPDDSATAGTVLETDPQAGVTVPRGTRVTIVVATQPAPSADDPSPSESADGND